MYIHTIYTHILNPARAGPCRGGGGSSLSLRGRWSAPSSGSVREREGERGRETGRERERERALHGRGKEELAGLQVQTAEAWRHWVGC